MPEDTPTPSRDFFTAARPVLTHLIYAAAGAWVTAYVLTGRFPAPTMTSPPQPNTGVMRVVIDDPPKAEMPACPAVEMPAPHDPGPRDSDGPDLDDRQDPVSDPGPYPRHDADPAPSRGLGAH